MKSFLAIVWLYISVQMIGCAMWKPKPPEPVAPPPAEAKYTQPELDSLLSFTDVLLKAGSAERLAECERVLMLTNSDRGVGVNLHLYIAQLLTEACGDIHETWAKVQAGRADIPDRRVLSFLALIEQLQGKYDAELANRRELERQLKQTSQQAQTTQKRMKSRETELKELQDKLDALKDIEQNLGNKQGGHQHND